MERNGSSVIIILQHENHATPHLDLRWVTARLTNASRLSPSQDFTPKRLSTFLDDCVFPKWCTTCL